MKVRTETENYRTVKLSTPELLAMIQLIATDRLDRSPEFDDAKNSLGKKIVDVLKNKTKEAPCPQ